MGGVKEPTNNPYEMNKMKTLNSYGTAIYMITLK
jgi:hypothetical protein